jgi:putative phage-type endonuclease
MRSPIWDAVEAHRYNAAIAAADDVIVDERAEWLQWRRGGVGGSDVAGILGLSPWASPYSVWFDKVYGSDDDGETAAQEFGRRAEPMLAPWFHERTGLYVGGVQQRCTHRDDAHHRCTIDGKVYETPARTWPTEPLGAYEAKTTSAPAKEWETDGIPVYYQCQAQWTMHVLELDRVWFAVLHLAFGRPDLKVYELARDDDDIALIVEAVDEFWNDHVTTGNPPAVDTTTATTYATKRLPASVGDTVELADDLAAAVAQLTTLKAQAKHTEQHIAGLENEIRAALGTATEGMYRERLIVSHRPQSKRGIDVDALRARMPRTAAKFAKSSTFRVLRTHAPKESK